MEPFDIVKARENLKKRREEAAKERERLFYKASADCKAIIKMIIERFNPERIYQWGSLLDKKMFTDYSDIVELEKGMEVLTGVVRLTRKV